MKNRFLGVVVAAGLLVGAANVATYAATGSPFLLGKDNTADHSSSLTNTGAGPALELRTRVGAPPLTVSSESLVRRLNADVLDGNHARQLQTRPIVYRIPGTGAVGRLELSFPGLKERAYQVSYSVIAHMSAPGATISCYFSRGGGWYELLSYGSANADYSTSAASGIVDLRSAPESLECFTTGGTATLDADRPGQSQIVFTPINRLGAATAVIE